MVSRPTRTALLLVFLLLQAVFQPLAESMSCGRAGLETPGGCCCAEQEAPEPVLPQQIETCCSKEASSVPTEHSGSEPTDTAPADTDGCACSVSPDPLLPHRLPGPSVFGAATQGVADLALAVQAFPSLFRALDLRGSRGRSGEPPPGLTRPLRLLIRVFQL